MDRAIDSIKLSQLNPSWVIHRYALESFEEGLMDSSEVEEKISIVGDAKLHGGMCKILSLIVGKVLEIFPFIEASRPRSKSGIQSLCALHVALDKAKSLLQHCSECSKLYLAITGDSILMKFERARSSLQDSLTRVENIVPQNIGCQILEVVSELKIIVFELDQSEKQIGNDVISLLQKERRGNFSSNSNDELEIFHHAASRLGITSSRAALVERRALKKLIERARAEDDKRKESIVSYLLHLLRKYSKLFRGDMADDTDSQGSTPCSPSVLGSLDDISRSGGLGQAFEKQINSPSSFNSKQSDLIYGNLPIPPEELRCSISFQLMYDPVIISSGQTYERACIEKWFNDGHHTCPKTQQELPHLCLTPNYCVKGLIASWCEQNGVPIPDGPPESLDAHYWRFALSESETTVTRSTGCRNSCLLKETEIVPFDANGSSVQETLEGEMGSFNDSSCQAFEDDELQIYESLLAVLYGGESMSRKCEAVEQIRLLLKDDEEARIYMGANGFVEALVQFLKSAIDEGDEKAQEIGAMALFNITVNNNRNKETLLSSDTMPLLQRMISNPSTHQSATAVILNLSYLDKAKPVIGSSHTVPFLVQSLQSDSSCKNDALHTLYNLSTHPSNIQPLLDSGVVNALLTLLTLNPRDEDGSAWSEKVLIIFINIASTHAGRREMVSKQGLIGSLAMILDTGEPSEQEQVVSCLLILCNGDEYCSHMVLQEGVIPALVSISVSGSTKGREKSQKLLKLFREQRQREPLMYQPEKQEEEPDSKPLCKLRTRSLGRTLSSMWKNRNFSVYQC